MLTTWGRVLTRTAGLSALPAYKAVIPAGQFVFRGLATVSTPKKAANTTTVTKKTGTTGTTTAKAKAPATKTTTAAATKKVASKTAAGPTTSKKKAAADDEATEKPAKKEKKTEEEKQKEHIKALLKKALDPPTVYPKKSAWIEFLKSKFAAVKGSNEGVAALLRKEHTNWSNEYKNLTPAQLEDFATKAHSGTDARKQEIADWVKQHTPAEIYQANLARTALRNIKLKSDPVPRGLRTDSFRAIPDERYPLRARSPNVLYVKENLVNVPKEKKVESLPVLMKEYSTLPEAEQQKWKDLAAKDLIRYHNQLRSIGIDPAATS